MTAENIIKSITGQTVTAAQVPDYLAAHPTVRDAVYTLSVHPGKASAVTQGSLSWAVATTLPPFPRTFEKQKLYAKEMSFHAFATYGCTTCHWGSGRELVQNNAHGDTDFWMRPLMPAKYQDAACAQCHVTHNPKLFTAQYLPEMTTIARGQQLFNNACWGCHKIEGFSRGNVGPELSYEGRLVTYHTISRQLWDPRYKTNNCVMPYFFSVRIVPGANGADMVENANGKLLPVSSITQAAISNPEVLRGLRDRGYIPDATRQADVRRTDDLRPRANGRGLRGKPSARIAHLSA